ncbi:MAG: class I SAM-dependent methyltransferase [Bryobacteraceae bacterium]
MAENTYDSIPYPTFPRLATHPDRMAAVALLFGMEPAPVDRCRVLEIGCGNAGNLLPMAYALPRSRFLGIDLAEDPIAHARADIRALGLENIEVAARDLRALGPEVGEFDYIIAHGVYSWVPEDVRGRLLALCRQRLAPSGVALVSYNLYPGRHIRQMLREMMFHHTRGDAPQQCVDHARRFLDWLAKSCQAPATFRTLIEEDAAALLAYEREQYTDFLYLRSFRHTLLCREEVPLSRSPRAETMDRLCFSAPVQMVEGAAAVRIGARQPAVEAVAQAMGACYPLPVTFQELLPYAGSAAELREMLLALISVGFAQCHAYGFPCQDSVSERPRATALARYQAQRSLQLANVIHTLINMDEFGRRLVLLLDGTRDRAALARDLAAGPDAPTPEEIARLLPERLQQMAGLGLLEA